MVAAGIAPASRNGPVIIQQSDWADTPHSGPHLACTDLALRERVACWHRLTADVREKIVELARGQQGFSCFGES
jgi:hypothetical protein